MARFSRPLATWTSVGLVLLAMLAGVDLHVWEHASHEHGLLEAREIFVPTGECSEGDRQHVEASERRTSSSCVLCLRGQHQQVLLGDLGASDGSLALVGCQEISLPWTHDAALLDARRSRGPPEA